MADETILERRSALAAIYETGDFGAVGFAGPGIELSERPAMSVVQVEAGEQALEGLGEAVSSAVGAAPSLTPNRSTGNGPIRILGTGSGRWIVSEPERRDLAALLRSALPDSVAVTDLGHARTVIRVSGPEARAFLSKGTSIDTHASTFPVNSSRMTGLFHASVLIDCKGSRPDYDIYVHRSYAQHLWEMLLDAALEFGCRVR